MKLSPELDLDFDLGFKVAEFQGFKVE